MEILRLEEVEWPTQGHTKKQGQAREEKQRHLDSSHFLSLPETMVPLNIIFQNWQWFLKINI